MSGSAERGAADSTTYARVGWTLLIGLLLSIAVMVVGLALTAARGADASRVVPLHRELSGLTHGDAPAVLDLGILLLFATPVAGVAVAFVRMLHERDRAFAAVSGCLLILLFIAFGIAIR